MTSEISISTITPVYSGEKYLPDLIEQINIVREKWAKESYPFQIIESIFVVDSAIDNSLSVLKALAANKPWIKVVELSKNFGQHPATICGVLYSAGDWVITLDEDLQHHPSTFIHLLSCVNKQPTDVVYAKPPEHVHQSLLRDWGSRGFKKIIANITDNPHVINFNSFRLIRGSIARAAASVCAHETYYDISLCWFTNKIQTKILKLQDQRFIESGKSGYSFSRLLSHARRLIVSSQTRFLRIGAAIGFVSILFSALMAVYHLYLKIENPEAIAVRGWTSLFLTILFMGGLSATLLSIIIEYLGNISLQTQGKPVFFTVDRSADHILQLFFQNNSNAVKEKSE